MIEKISLYMSRSKQMQQASHDIGVHQFAEMRNDGARHLVLDTREPEELAVTI